MSPLPHSIPLRAALFALAGALLVPAQSFAQHFQPLTTYAKPAVGGFSPGGLYSGEFNGDGRPDFFTVSAVSTGGFFDPFAPYNTYIRLLLSNPSGGFTQTTVTLLNQIGRYAAAGDVNGDGFQDIVIIGSGAPIVVFGEGDGTFPT